MEYGWSLSYNMLWFQYIKDDIIVEMKHFLPILPISRKMHRKSTPKNLFEQYPEICQTEEKEEVSIEGATIMFVYTSLLLYHPSR